MDEGGFGYATAKHDPIFVTSFDAIPPSAAAAESAKTLRLSPRDSNHR